MTKEQKNEVIEVLKDKFSQYNNFYITDTESLSVAQVGTLRRACFDKKVEMKVAKNTLIKKALEALDSEKYAGIYDALHNVTALMFTENPKQPALIMSSFRKDTKGERPVLKAAFINGEIYFGDKELVTLTKIKTKEELIGDVIALLQAPAQRVISALLNKDEANAKKEEEVKAAETPVAEVKAETPEAPKEEPKVETTEAPKVEVKVETPEAPKAEVTEEKPVEEKKDDTPTA